MAHPQSPRRRGQTHVLHGFAVVALATAACVTAACVTVLGATRAGAAPTTTVDLSLTGLATATSPAGGSVVGIRPGESVVLRAAPIPTAGLAAIPALDGLLDGIDLATGYQVVLHLPAAFPGGKRDAVLGSCGGQKELTLTFPREGTFTFSWTAKQVRPLCLLPANLGSLYGNQLKSAGVALDGKLDWTGSVVVSTSPPPGGVSVQPPRVRLAPSVPVLGQLPTLSVPGLSLPTTGVPVPPGVPQAQVPGATGTGQRVHSAVVRGRAIKGRDSGLLGPEIVSTEFSAKPASFAGVPLKAPLPLTLLTILVFVVTTVAYGRKQMKQPAGRHRSPS